MSDLVADRLLQLDPRNLRSIESCDAAKDSVLAAKYAIEERRPDHGSLEWRTAKNLAMLYEKICHQRSDLRREGLGASDRAIAVAAERVLSPDDFKRVMDEARAFEASRKARADVRRAAKAQRLGVRNKPTP